MVNRKEKQLQEFKELINRDWQLSLDEEGFLDSVFSLLLSRETKKAAEIINLFYSEEWESLLDMIPDYYISNYASFNLNMIEEGDCEVKSLEDFDDDEIKEEYFDRFDVAGSLNIISDMHLEEMTELFLSFSPQKQQYIINLLKNDKI